MLRLGKNIEIDAREFATEVSAALGMRGSGKSNVMAVAAEGLLEARVQVVILDYVGIWPALRLAPDGRTPSGLAIPILGGRTGDIPLQATAGRLVAETLGRSGSPAVLDVSAFSKGDRCRFAADFAERLFEVKKDNPGPCWLLLEEAQRFVPQKIQTGVEFLARMLGAFEEIAEVGRNYGIGLGLISQRPQKIAKDVLNLADNVFAFRANGVLERKAVAEWVQEKDAEGRGEVAGELPKLARGTALVWSPIREIYGKFVLYKKSTYDAGATPLAARAAVKLEPLDLDALKTAMAVTIEEAKANDPKPLRAEVAALRRQLEQAQRQAPARTIEVDTIPAGLMKAIADANDQLIELDHHVDQLRNVLGFVEKRAALTMAAMGNVGALMAEAREWKSPSNVTVTTQQGSKLMRATVPEAVPLPAPRSRVETGGELARGAREMLTAVAARGTLTRTQIATLAGMAITGGTFSTYLSLLKGQGLVEVDGQNVTVTPTGRAAAGNPSMPAAPADVLAIWRPKMPGKARDMLELFAAERGPFSKAEVAERLGLDAAGGTFSTYLSILRTNGLIQKTKGGFVVNPELAL